MATPKLAFDKGPRQYYARFDGKKVYFGKDHAQAAQRFAEMLARYQAGEPVTTRARHDALRIVEAVDRYLAYATSYYDAPLADSIRRSLLRLCELYGREPLDELSPKKLKTLQQHLVQKGALTRYGINRTTEDVRRFVKWCVSEELCPPAVYDALRCVAGLRRGKTAAPEPEPAHIPTEADIRAVASHMPGTLGDAVMLQYFTGCRPGELLGIRPQDVETEGSVWRIRVDEHKTAYRGHVRTLYAGPEAQKLLRPYLLREHDRPCFRPRDSADAVTARSTVHRRPNQKPKPRKTKRTMKDQYDVAAYRRAVVRACGAAGVQKFTPHSIRHTAAARFRREFGLDVCQRLLGHKHAAITEVYAQADEATAVHAMEQIG
ncbi:MAG: tyrosine-type recombinase/integrase [Candidatus Hydrogenedentota bacterium]